MANLLVFPIDSLRAAIRELMRGFGSQPTEVELVTENLLQANLTGHDSHGIGMLPRYADAFREGWLQPNAHAEIRRDSGATLSLDGRAGFGQVIGHEAMEIGIARAKQHGCCILALGNAHHLGRIGAWAEMAVAEGLISIHFVNVISRPIVAPWGGPLGGARLSLGRGVACAQPVVRHRGGPRVFAARGRGGRGRAGRGRDQRWADLDRSRSAAAYGHRSPGRAAAPDAAHA